MSWKPHPHFKAGRYKALVEELLERTGAVRERHLVSLIGSLSFLGRMEEAEELFALSPPSSQKIGSRFFLAIGWTRRSQYERSRLLLEQNKKEAGIDPMEQFFVQQGKAFFLFYTGRLEECLASAQASRKWALASGDLWALCLANDAFGHVQVRTGEIHSGLKYLEEARRLAGKLGNLTSVAAIEISSQLYAWEYGLQEESLGELEARVKGEKPENSYSHSNLALELARQFTLRGKFREAGEVLELVAPAIYSNKNRRQEILLNLRLAELSGRKGELFQARHFLWFSRRLLHSEVDATYELAAFGIERKLDLAGGKIPDDARWESLSPFSSTRDKNLKVRLRMLPEEKQNPEDRVHGILFRAARGRSLEQKISPLLQAGFLAEVSLELGLKPGARAVALLPGNLGLLTQSADGIVWRNAALTNLQSKLLRALGGAEATKQDLVEAVWGYQYHPLRHDSMLYAALSGLRKILGEAGSWLQPTEKGYRLDSEFFQPALAAPEVPVAPPVSPSLATRFNHRQLEILEWARSSRFLSVAECRKRFGISEVTAQRDMDGLRRDGLMVRIGKARATRYGLAKGE